MEEQMPMIDFFGQKISRLIMGGNPFSGNSHVSRELDDAMMDYYSTDNIKKAVVHALECGVNTIQVRADRHIFRILRELRNEGHMPLWIAQTASEFRSFEGNVRQTMTYEPAAIYHHGTLTDKLFKAGEYGAIEENLKILRSTGRPVGIGTHMPQVIEYAEEHGWDVDFYMACVYNLSVKDRVSSAITGISNANESFYEADIPVMYQTIRSTAKPCLAFKILGASRRCATPETVKSAFAEAFASIKPCDAVVVGMYQGMFDQIRANSDIVKEIGHAV